MKRILLLPVLLAVLLINCTKVDVALDDNVQDDNPDIVYYDNYPIELATYKADSFITSGHQVLAVGYHTDPLFGRIYSFSYAAVNLPAENPLRNQNVIFDSLVLTMRPNGFYGDSTLPFKLRVTKLTENIENDDNSNTTFFSPRTFACETVPVGEKTVFIRPNRDTAVTIRLSDALGNTIFQKLKTNATEIQSADNFLKYLKGFRISVDTSITNAICYFGLNTTSTVMRLYYRINSTVQVEKTLDFSLNTTYHFNNINYNALTTPLSVFTPNKRQLKQSTLTGNKVYIHSNAGFYTKINFPGIFSLKELHPYIKIMKAELIIKPAPGTYSYPYELPDTLNLYVTDENNLPVQSLNEELTGTPLTGNLVIDRLYGVDTKYSYDVTGYLSALLNAGRFSTSALILMPPDYFTDRNINRLVLNDQSLANSIQLKLYVLGL